MPWCPNCKTEYQEGYTVCKDCKAELVAELATELIPFVQSDSKKVAEKLVRYLEYSGLEAKIEFNEESEMYQIYIPEDKEKDARKLYQAFIFVERENLVKGHADAEDSENDESLSAASLDNSEADNHSTDDEGPEASYVSSEAAEDFFDENSAKSDAEMGPSSESEDDEDDYASEEQSQSDAENTSVYVMKSEQYKDLAGTVWVFLGLGVLGLIFVILNVLEVIQILYGWMPNLVMGALFVIFIYIGISTKQKAKKIQSEIDEENRLTKEINQWLEININERFLEEVKDPGISDELNYLKAIATIKEMLIKEFGPQNMAYLDRLIDEYYSSTFE